MIDPHFIAAILLLLVLAVFAIGYGVGRWDNNQTKYHDGYLAGMREERSRINARMIPAKLDAFKKGRIVERTKRFWDSRN